VSILILLIELYTYVIFAAVILSWVPDLRKYPIAAWIDSVTEPVFAQVRKLLPAMGGMDLSPLVVLLALGLLRKLLR
jgi:YggT family protein